MRKERISEARESAVRVGKAGEFGIEYKDSVASGIARGVRLSRVVGRIKSDLRVQGILSGFQMMISDLSDCKRVEQSYREDWSRLRRDDQTC